MGRCSEVRDGGETRVSTKAVGNTARRALSKLPKGLVVGIGWGRERTQDCLQYLQPEQSEGLRRKAAVGF